MVANATKDESGVPNKPGFGLLGWESKEPEKVSSASPRQGVLPKLLPSLLHGSEGFERNTVLANCYLPIANCLVVKERPTSTPRGCHTLADSR